jgi:hypothetical protein
MSITKETVLKAINTTSNDISLKLNEVYSSEIDEISESLAISYELLYQNINIENQEKIPDNDFQSMTMFWTGFNTILSAVELFCRGYNKEPMMLMRNTLEIFASAYDIHKDDTRYKLLRDDPKKFKSMESINKVKEIQPIIGHFYGLLSDRFSHVSTLHTVPHNSSTPLCVGGLYDPKKTSYSTFNLIMIEQILEVLNSVMEFTLIKYTDNLRYWKKVNANEYLYIPNKIKEKDLLKRMEKVMKGL